MYLVTGPQTWGHQLEVSLNYCSQNGGNLYRAPYYDRNPNIGPRIDSNLGQSPTSFSVLFLGVGG